MAVTHVFAGIPVDGYEQALAFYERLFGRPPDRFPTDHEAVWQLTDTGLIYVVTDPARAGTGLLTLIVDDLDAWVAAVSDRGIDVGEPVTIPGAVRRATIADPEGNRITLGEVPAASQ